MNPRTEISQDEVLDDFVAEWSPDSRVLQDYIRMYPAFGPALLDVHHQLQLQIDDAAKAETRPRDEAWIASSWEQFLSLAVPATTADPFAAIKGARFAEVRTALGIRAATLMGFRDRCVELASVPARFLGRMAAALSVTQADLERFLALPPRAAPAQSYRAEGTPDVSPAKVSFEDLLLSAREDAETRARLMDGDA